MKIIYVYDGSDIATVKNICLHAIDDLKKVVSLCSGSDSPELRDCIIETITQARYKLFNALDGLEDYEEYESE